MAASCFSASASLELNFLRPGPAANKLRFSISRRNALRKLNHSSTTVAFRARIRAVQREEVVVVETEDGIDLNGNGSYNYVNGKSSNGSVVGVKESENGSLVKYVNGNGGVGIKLGEEIVEKKAEKKKTIEEIGQEEAWFKKSAQGKVEVYV